MPGPARVVTGRYSRDYCSVQPQSWCIKEFHAQRSNGLRLIKGKREGRHTVFGRSQDMATAVKEHRKAWIENSIQNHVSGKSTTVLFLVRKEKRNIYLQGILSTEDRCTLCILWIDIVLTCHLCHQWHIPALVWAEDFTQSQLITGLERIK